MPPTVERLCNVSKNTLCDGYGRVLITQLLSGSSHLVHVDRVMSGQEVWTYVHVWPMLSRSSPVPLVFWIMCIDWLQKYNA